MAKSRCNTRPTVHGRKGAVYALIDGDVVRLRASELRSGQLRDGRPLSPDLALVLGATAPPPISAFASDTAMVRQTVSVAEAREGLGQRRAEPLVVEPSMLSEGALVTDGQGRIVELVRMNHPFEMLGTDQPLHGWLGDYVVVGPNGPEAVYSASEAARRFGPPPQAPTSVLSDVQAKDALMSEAQRIALDVVAASGAALVQVVHELDVDELLANLGYAPGSFRPMTARLTVKKFSFAPGPQWDLLLIDATTGQLLFDITDQLV